VDFIVNNAERSLLTTLREYWESAPTQRCLHIKLSQFVNPQEDNVEKIRLEISRQLEGLTDDRMARLYSCDDLDVFIVSRFLTQRSVNQFLSRIHSSQNLTPISPEDLGVLFEVGADWPKLRNICEAKIAALQDKQNAKSKKPKLVDTYNKQTIIPVREDHIATLQSRRGERREAAIMVVEDDLFSQRMVKNAIKDEYDVSMLDKGANAVALYAALAPDVLFLDIGLPDTNGHEVLEKIYAIDPSAYVIMFSGNGDRPNVLKAVQLGAKGFIGKPFSRDKIFQYINKSPFIAGKKSKEQGYGRYIH
jgi:two-component system chemotaxis response regulator CheY